MLTLIRTLTALPWCEVARSWFWDPKARRFTHSIFGEEGVLEVFTGHNPRPDLAQSAGGSPLPPQEQPPGEEGDRHVQELATVWLWDGERGSWFNSKGDPGVGPGGVGQLDASFMDEAQVRKALGSSLLAKERAQRRVTRQSHARGQATRSP